MHFPYVIKKTKTAINYNGMYSPILPFRALKWCALIKLLVTDVKFLMKRALNVV